MYLIHAGLAQYVFLFKIKIMEKAPDSKWVVATINLAPIKADAVKNKRALLAYSDVYDSHYVNMHYNKCSGHCGFHPHSTLRRVITGINASFKRLE